MLIDLATNCDTFHVNPIKRYWLMYHMAMDKVGVSIAEMQRILELKDYKTLLLIAHKVRKMMFDRDARYHFFHFRH